MSKTSRRVTARKGAPALEADRYFRYRYLMGAMSQNQLAMTVRLACIPEDVARLPDILESWRAASARMVELAQTEAGLSDQIVVEDVPATVRARLREIAADPLFQASFSALPTSFKVVDIDKLVAPQREVNLDYVDSLRKRISGKTIEEVLEFCVGPRTEPPIVQALQTAPNQMTFSSRSLDLRFLGGIPKQISEDDIKLAYMGGQPTEAITILVGFGAAPINAYQSGRRLVLWNGFHRIVALRSAGISKVPIVVQHVANLDIEFPDNYFGLSRAYLLQNQRPVLVGDFFDNDLIVEVGLKPRKKTLKVMWGEEASVVPE
jgi:hypothetical protein